MVIRNSVVERVNLSGGGSVSTNASLSGDGTGGSPLGINLANANTWTGQQTFEGSSAGNTAVLASATGTGGGFTGTGIAITASTSDNTYSANIASNSDFAAGYFSDNVNSKAITLANSSYAADAIGVINTDTDYYIGGVAIPVSHWSNDAGYLSTVAVDGTTITGDGTPGNPLVASGGGGGGAPTGASYVTLSTNGSLTHERVLTASARVTITDAGAGSTVTLDLASGSVSDSYLSTGINANKIADGSVSDTEFQYIGTLTSNAQTQLDSKVSIAQARTLTYYGI